MTERERDQESGGERRSLPGGPNVPSLADVGSALACGVLAALVGAGPAALRLADAEGRQVWLVLTACAAPFTTLAVLVLRAAHLGLRSLVGEARTFARVFVATWLGSSVLFLYLLGRTLRATTHHHPLAGVTFALTGLVVLVACAVVAGRWANVIVGLRDAEHTRTHALLATATYALAAGLVLSGARALHTKLPPESAAALVDTTALMLAAALAARPEFRGLRALSILGPLLFLLAMALGITRISPALAATLAERAPAFGAFLSLLGRA